MVDFGNAEGGPRGLKPEFYGASDAALEAPLFHGCTGLFFIRLGIEPGVTVRARGRARHTAPCTTPIRCRLASFCPSPRRLGRRPGLAGADSFRLTIVEAGREWLRRSGGWRLDGADLALGTAGYDGESGFHGGPFEIGIDFEVAEEFFRDSFFVFAVVRLQIGAGAEANFRHGAGEFRGVSLAIGHRARDRVDDDVLGSGIVFGGVGVGDVEHVAGELNEGVLKSSAGAEEGPVAAAGELDALQHSVDTLVGAARRGPDAVEGLEGLLGVGFREGGGRQPLAFDLHVELAGGVLQGVVGGVMRAEFLVEVAENGYAYRVAHAIDCTRGLC